jgi:enoyl-CoA hydratase
MEATPSSII